MDVVEHWWGGEHGTMTRREAWLERDGEQWRVRVRARAEEYETQPCDEAAARAALAKVLATGLPWVRLG